MYEFLLNKTSIFLNFNFLSTQNALNPAHNISAILTARTEMFVFWPCNTISQTINISFTYTLRCSPTITLQAYIEWDAANFYSISELLGQFNAKHVTAETAVIVPVRAIRTYKIIWKSRWERMEKKTYFGVAKFGSRLYVDFQV